MTDLFEKVEDSYIAKIDEAIVTAGRLLDLHDAPDDDEEATAELVEQRYHCGVCTASVVMETVWPAIEQYINFLKGYKNVTQQ